MATLTGNTIASTYKDLLQVSNSNSGVDATLRVIEDGEGTSSALYLSSAAVQLSSSSKLYFRDTGLYIYSNADGDLDIVSDGTAIDSINIESAGGITLDAGSTTHGVTYEDDGTAMLQITNSSSDVIIKPLVNAKDIIFQQYDGTEVARIEDDTYMSIAVGIRADSQDGASIGTSSYQFSDLYLADGAVISLGDDADVTLTHYADNGVLVNSTRKIYFEDGSNYDQYIGSAGSGVTAIAAPTEVDITATTIDINGNADISGTLALGGNADFNGDLDVDGTSNLDNTDIDGTLVVDGSNISLYSSSTLNIDNSNTSNGVTIATATSGVPISIGHSTSETTVNDNLVLTGDADFNGSLDVDGTTNLDNTDVDGTLVVDGSNISLDSTSTLNIDNSNTSNGITIGTATSGVPISIGHTTSETTINDNLTITGDLKVNGDTVTQNVATMTVNDPIISLQTADNGANLGSDTNKDVGLAMFYHTGSAAKTAFLGWDDSASKLTFVPDASISSEVVSGSVGTIVADIEGDVTGDVTGTADVATSFTASANNSADETVYPVFVDGATGTQGAETDTGLTYNPSSGMLTISGELDAGSLDISGNADIDGTTNLDAVDIDGAVQIDSTVTVGANDQGYDIIFYGDTASANMTWDTSADDLIFNGAARVVVPDGQLVLGSTAVSSTAAELNLVDGITAGTVAASKAVIVDSNKDASGFRNITATGELDGATLDISGNADIDGTTNLDAVDIDGNVQLDGTLTVGVDGTGKDVKLFGDTSGAYILWDESADKLLTAGGALVDIVKDKLMIGGTAVTTTAAELNALDGITSTVSELNILDGDNSASTVTLADADRIILNDNGTMKQVAVSALNTYTSSSIAADDISVGDGAVTLSTSSGNITIDAAANDTDIIFKGTDNTSDITMLTLDGSEAGAATFNNKIVATELDISGDIDVDGTSNLDVVDIDGAVDMATTLTLAGNADFNGDLDVDGTTNLDAVDIDSTVQIDGATAFGFNSNGQDVKIFGNTSGSYWEFDASQNSLSSVGAAATSAPRFGVGVANPDYALDIRTDTGGGGYAAFIWNGGNGGDRYGVTVRGGAVDPTSTNTIYYNATDSNDDQVGYIWNTDNTFQLVDPSDERLKDNIRDTSVKGLDSINAMKVRDFEWKKGGGTMVGGFVAQEMDDAFSPAVAKPDWEEGKTKDEIMWGVSRDRLVPVLVKAIQELSAKVTALENK